MILKFALRNVIKRPFLNIIKVVGLSLAFSCILIIVLFLKTELSFDRFHKKSDRIYRFTVTSPGFFEGKHFARVYKPDYIPGMAKYFPEIESYVRLAPIRGGVMRHNQDYINISEAFICDSTFFKIFDSELLVGNPEEILNSPGSMVISESFAIKTFGKSDPVGQVLTLPGGQYYGENIDFTVKGVMKDFPQNCHFHPEFITTSRDKTMLDDWAWTYLLLSGNANPGSILSGFKDFYSSNLKIKSDDVKTEAHLQKISDIHLHSNKMREIESNRDMSVIYSLSLAALMLLLIALANLTNLNMGMAGFSDKYLFVSKVSGSSSWMTLRYFLLEGVLIIIASFLISVFMVLPAHIAIKKHYALNLFAESRFLILLVAMLFSLLVIISCILPLLKQLATGLKTSLNSRTRNNLNRKGLSKGIVVLQFAISIGLIVAVLVIRRQTDYALKSSMGFDDNNLICFEDVHSNVQARFGVFKEELLKYNSVKSVSAMFEPPGGEAIDMFQFKMEGYIPDETKKADNMIGIFPCDYSFAGIFNLKLISGNNFSETKEDPEGSGEYIINESAMKRLHYKNPEEIIGKEFRLITGIDAVKIPSGKITGVVRDFHLSSIKKEIEPLVFFKRKDLLLINIVISFQPGQKTKALTDIKSVWTKMFPGYPFQYQYISTMYENVYRTERLQAVLLSIFTFIALFVCSMGLLGMSLLTTRRRTREIGIRKINGAKMSKIVLMLNWDLLKWIIVSIAIAIPFAFLVMNKWLENFAYKTTLSWWIFGLAGLSAMLIAVITVSVQSWKAAGRNPVEALRYE
jgi:putative ABC transport system permease protein